MKHLRAVERAKKHRPSVRQVDPGREWQNQAACKGSQELFFQEGHIADRIHLKAQEICYGCPVWDSCLEYSFMNREQFGIWGGMTIAQRKALFVKWREKGYRADRKIFA